MQKVDGAIAYSASDLVNFLECEHLTSLDLINLETPLPKTADDDEARLIQDKGHEHERRFAEALKAGHASFVDIAAAGGSLDQKVIATLEAMHAGTDIIYQATLRDGCLIGHADFLRKACRPSGLGDYSYEVLDTKLARSAKAKFIVQLGFYSALLAKAQGVEPQLMHVVLGNGTELPFRCADFSRYVDLLLGRFMQRVTDTPGDTYPDPCAKCAQCRWSELCEERRVSDDHLWQVANITRLQIKKLQSAGVPTLEALATLPEGARVPKMTLETLGKLRHQASLQLKARQTGVGCLDLLPIDMDSVRGFARMPQSDEGDLFFDMEGDPLEEGGLEYLFGLYLFEDGNPAFKAFWAHSRAEEKRAFEQFMDFVTGWLKRYPKAHVYHYAAYERTALEKLMSLHGTREAEVDNLFRAGKLVDLYKVVREAIRVSEPRYSIKNIEHFYLESRTGDVKSAGASIVYYEKWKDTGDPSLLKEIEDYNFDDVRSTYELQQWLLTLRPGNMPWATLGSGTDDKTPEVGRMTDAELRLIPYRAQLLESLPENRNAWGEQEHLKELTFQLLDFHRRAAKPEWWAMFSRMEMTTDELLDDGECLAGLTLDPANPPRPVARSIEYTYRFPEQESKLKTGDQATVAQTGEQVRELVVDEENRLVRFRRTAKADALPFDLALGPGRPISSAPLQDAIFRFADSLVTGTHTWPAVEAVLMRGLPRVRGLTPGMPLVSDDAPDPLQAIVDNIAGLDGSYMFIQGPPGAGKTYTGSHVIVDLMRRGYRVGVASNSHKAINNLLDGVEKAAKSDGVSFRGVKKSTSSKEDSLFNGKFIADVFSNDDVAAALHGGALLVAGTAWLFASEVLEQALDYLFIDEAGQVALANLVAMGTSAKNIVLLGDQMQLSQPVQGVHPGNSGDSTLDYLLQEMATIPPARGIFLGTTWRMHPDVCRFISEAVYDGRLHPEPNNSRQGLVLSNNAHPALVETGLRYIPVEHDACSQRSDEEGAVVLELVRNLLGQHYRDKHGVVHAITLDDILVVAPYNMQVNLLKSVLPDGARVGTVDKFQGQEAEVVVVSMATSNGDNLPRNIEFLYSKNRLNVAISRAKCLALFIANSALMSIRCSTPEDMALVNTLCWVGDYSVRQ